MTQEEGMREYHAIVWIQGTDRAGERVTLFANNLDEATEQLKRKYGDRTMFSLYNEEDAEKSR